MVCCASAFALRTSAFSSFLRNPQFSSDIQDELSNFFAIVSLFLREHAPDLCNSQQCNHEENIPESKSIARAHVYPSSPNLGILQGAPMMNASQVALRMVGYPWGAHPDYTDRTKFGGSGLHVDKLDPSSPLGFPTLYFCLTDDGGKERVCYFHGNCRLLENCDLLVFQRNNGGRAVRIQTMKLGYVCILFHHANAHLHGSVFPRDGKPEKLTPGVEGMKIVTYQSRHVNKIAFNCTKHPDVFKRYFEEHNAFRKKLQEQGASKYKIATAHYVVLSRILRECIGVVACHRQSCEKDDLHKWCCNQLEALEQECRVLHEHCEWCDAFLFGVCGRKINPCTMCQI